MMKFLSATILIVLLRCMGSAPISASEASRDLALEWMACPPQNPYDPNSKATPDRCNSPSDWDFTCIGFVYQIAAHTEEPTDPRLSLLQKGFSNGGASVGDAARAYYELLIAGYAHAYVPGEDLSKIPAGAAVFFKLDGTTFNHVGIASGYITSETGIPEPLIISTGFNSEGTSGIHLLPLSKLGGQKAKWWHLLGWANI